MNKIVLFSGGLDSTVLLYDVVKRNGAENVIALSMFYGQKHAKEQEYADATCKELDVQLINLDMSTIFQFNTNSSALLTGSTQKIEHKSYAEQLAEKPGTVSAYVPFRNGLFLSAAASVALQFEANEIYYGAHADDAAGNAYPDCTLEFIKFMQLAIDFGSGKQTTLIAPFAKWNKAQIVALGKTLEVDFNKTWSCYEGKRKPCGTCGTCIDRKAALEANGITNID